MQHMVSFALYKHSGNDCDLHHSFLLSRTGFGVLDGGWAEKRQSGSCVLIMKDLITSKVG